MASFLIEHFPTVRTEYIRQKERDVTPNKRRSIIACVVKSWIIEYPFIWHLLFV